MYRISRHVAASTPTQDRDISDRSTAPGRYVPEPGRHEPERLVPALYPRSWRAGGHGYRGDR